MEYQFKVGDTVRVICWGAGVAPVNMGKKTTITAVGGHYNSQSAVKTSDFTNSWSNNWIACKSFALVKTATNLEELMTELDEKIKAKEIREKEK